MTPAARSVNSIVSRLRRQRYPSLRIILTACTFFLLAPGLSARAATDSASDLPTPRRSLVVAAVQFTVSPEIYQSPDAFRRALEASLNKLKLLAAGERIDLVVFPEYSSAFLGWAFLNNEEQRELLRNPRDSRALIVKAVQEAEPYLDTIWGALAREHRIWILAGTALVTEISRGDGELQIRNRALLYSKDGKAVWSQDKAFPGQPEKAILNLSPGNPDDAVPFEINGYDVALTICRDTHSRLWETHFNDADLWLDIKANELPYSDEYYQEALAARLAASPIHRGLTVSLAGGFLGYRFTGITEYFVNDRSVAATGPIAPGALMMIRLEED